MSPSDESELHRLCELLASVDNTMPAESPSREAFKKAALALHSAFLGGLRNDIERQYKEMDLPLSDEQKAKLLAMGIEPV